VVNNSSIKSINSTFVAVKYQFWVIKNKIDSIILIVQNYYLYFQIMNKQTIKIAATVLLSFNLSFGLAQKPSDYKIVWEENFDNAKLDKNIWNLENNRRGGGNAEFQYYSPKSISVEKHSEGVNCLVLSAVKQRYKGRPAISGRLNTEGKLSVKYGKIEVRVHVPKIADGLWPAFWMMGDDLAKVGWPRCGEIDILEMGNANGIKHGTQDRYFNGACHWGESFNGGKYPNFSMAATSSYSMQEGFHLFTLIWTPDSINMYLDKDKYPDAKPYFKLGIKGDGSANHPSRYFHKPFHLIANLAVGGHFTGLGSPSKKACWISSRNKNFRQITALPQDGSPAKMYIDYVRIYQNGTPGEELNINP
jgi:beta-glucanase (GH16 family)